jgi:hypothetical protein
VADLITLARAQQNPQLHDVATGLLSALISAASVAVQQYCHREFTSTARTELYNGTGEVSLILNEYPVTDIDTIKTIDDDDTKTTIAETDYRYTAAGIVQLKYATFPVGFQNIEVVYTGGYTTIPADLQEAVVQIATKLYADGIHDPQVAIESLGDYSMQRMMWSSEGFGGTIKHLLAGYKDYRV